MRALMISTKSSKLTVPLISSFVLQAIHPSMNESVNESAAPRAQSRGGGSCCCAAWWWCGAHISPMILRTSAFLMANPSARMAAFSSLASMAPAGDHQRHARAAGSVSSTRGEQKRRAAANTALPRAPLPSVSNNENASRSSAICSSSSFVATGRRAAAVAVLRRLPRAVPGADAVVADSDGLGDAAVAPPRMPVELPSASDALSAPLLLVARAADCTKARDTDYNAAKPQAPECLASADALRVDLPTGLSNAPFQ